MNTIDCLPPMEPKALRLLSVDFKLFKSTEGACLGGKFSKREFAGILTCFQNEVFFPAAIEDMAGALLDDSSGNKPLAQKVANLTHLERYALADLMELSWNNQSDKCDVFDIAESLGLQFANVAN